jgi:late competence protein required for DNA uptake (superfamily II DNA/RNA helicase)
MSQEDRNRILQLVAYVKNMNYQSKQAMMDGSNYGRMLDSLQAAQKLCVPIVNSISRTSREYHCPGCDDFQATEESGPNLVCTRCRLVLLVGRRQEPPERHKPAQRAEEE